MSRSVAAVGAFVAAAAGLPSPFGSAALQLYTLACATGHGDQHVPLLVDVMAELEALGRLEGPGRAIIRGV